MKIAGTYTIDAPRDQVWAALHELNVLARVTPGCQKLEMTGENEYEGTVKIGIQSIKGTYSGRIRLTDIQPPSHYTLVANGKSSNGIVDGTGIVDLEEHNGKTLLTYSGDAKISGTLARVGQRLIEGAAKQLINQMLKALAEEIKLRREQPTLVVSTPTPVLASPTIDVNTIIVNQTHTAHPTVPEEDILVQQSLLKTHRVTLQHLLLQRATHGISSAPPAILNGIDDARANIRKIKAALRDWKVEVDDFPGDEELTTPVIASADANMPTGQVIIGTTNVSVIGVSEPSVGYAPDAEQQQHLRALLRMHESRLRVLELQQAEKGNSTPPEVITDIARIQQEIASITVLLGAAHPTIGQQPIRHLKQQARNAYYRKQWGEAESLLAQALAVDLGDQDIERKLRDVQNRLNADSLYQTIRALKDDDLWKETLDALADFDRQYPEAGDPEKLWDWAIERRSFESQYAAARQARQSNQWQQVLVVLDHIRQQLPQAPDPDNLRAWAAPYARADDLLAQAQRAQAYNDWRAVLGLFDRWLALPPPNTVQTVWDELLAWAERLQQRDLQFERVITPLEELIASFPSEQAAQEAKRLLEQARQPPTLEH